MFCFAEPEKEMKMQWEKRQSFLNKKRKVTGKRETLGEGQICLEGI